MCPLHRYFQLQKNIAQNKFADAGSMCSHVSCTSSKTGQSYPSQNEKLPKEPPREVTSFQIKYLEDEVEDDEEMPVRSLSERWNWFRNLVAAQGMSHQWCSTVQAGDCVANILMLRQTMTEDGRCTV